VLNPPGVAQGDDITYSKVDGASVFTHPLSVSTLRNGVFVGQEPGAAGISQKKQTRILYLSRSELFTNLLLK